MEVTRSLTLILPDDADLLATVRGFGQLRRDLSETAFNGGKPLNSVGLHMLSYQAVRGRLSSQMVQTAFRSVAGAYASAKANKKPAKKAFTFSRNLAVFLIGDRGRDASFTQDGKLSVWTVAGRKRLDYRVPERLRPLFEKASGYRSLTITEGRNGRLEATLIIGLAVDEPKAGLPVGVDLNETNAVVAVKLDGSTFFETGLATRVLNKRTRKTVRRLQIKLAAVKAEGKSARSVRRALKRLSRKRSHRTKDFARCVAKRLVEWAGSASTLVFEKLKFDKRRKSRKGISRRLNEWPHALIKQCVRNRAELAGVAVAEVDPAYTSQTCSRCGNLGERHRHSFQCPVCGFAAHADVNAAVNIGRKFTGAAKPPGGPPVNRPRSTPGRKTGMGKPPTLVEG